MSFRPGLFPHLRSSLFPSSLRPARPQPRCSIHSAPFSRPTAKPRLNLLPLGLGLTFATYHLVSPSRQLQCDTALPPPSPPDLPAESILSVYQLTFGTVSGICAGVFLKKGLRAIAFLLGGVFVLLQVSRLRG